ncbi:molybdenum cofactor biosynthesis protein MoaE [Granulicoccus sp. GXG6511]|uniref:molybdenum cofactor biosynthesis protein MoaE n=1 Tax=Granulicoccus sp. GXG6511 TaxID=3381351 RepID=UPI003D7CBAFB
MQPQQSRQTHSAVSDQPLSVDRVLDAVRSDAVGGLTVFVGLVRDHDGGKSVRSLDYSAHPSATTELARVVGEVADRHEVLAVAAEHRVGALRIGDLAVVVAAGAVHRADAFAAARDLIDTLKSEVPIWKEQHYADGSVDWVGCP